MKIRLVIVFFVFVVFSISFVPVGFAQNARCVITEKQGSLATVSCPGVGTRTENLGGTADRYKVGDTVDVPNVSQGQGAQGQRSTVNPGSGRR